MINMYIIMKEILNCTRMLNLVYDTFESLSCNIVLNRKSRLYLEGYKNISISNNYRILVDNIRKLCIVFMHIVRAMYTPFTSLSPPALSLSLSHLRQATCKRILGFWISCDSMK